MVSLDGDDCIEAVASELSSLQENKTWEFCTLPTDVLPFLASGSSGRRLMLKARSVDTRLWDSFKE